MGLVSLCFTHYIVQSLHVHYATLFLSYRMFDKNCTIWCTFRLLGLLKYVVDFFSLNFISFLAMLNKSTFHILACCLVSTLFVYLVEFCTFWCALSPPQFLLLLLLL